MKDEGQQTARFETNNKCYTITYTVQLRLLPSVRVNGLIETRIGYRNIALKLDK